MSTFGKKSLIWWDYQNSHNREITLSCYNHTPTTIQLLILQQWYPIGMKVLIDSKYLYQIINHKPFSQLNQILHLELQLIDTTIPPYKHIILKHPLLIKPLQSEIIQLKREIKLNKLLQ
jgi:hypothetical protein